MYLHAQQNAHFFHSDKNLFNASVLHKNKLALESLNTLFYQKCPQNKVRIEIQNYLTASNQFYIDKSNSNNSLPNFAKSTRFEVLKQRSFLQLGQHCLTIQNYTQAVTNLESVNSEILSKKENDQLQRNLAMAYIGTLSFDNYKNLPTSITTEFDTSLYYKNLISYLQGNYKQTLAAMQTTEFKNNYPDELYYYNLEADFLTNTNPTLQSKIQQKLKSTQTFKYKLPLTQLLGQIAIKQGDYKNAEKLLQQVAFSNQARSTDIYKLAYCQYQRGDFDKCLSNLKTLSYTTDIISQQSWYLRAICQLALGQVNDAYESFLNSIKCNQDNELNNLAELNLCKLSFKQNNTSLSIQQLNYFLKTNPTSIYRNEAAQFLMNLLIKNNQIDSAFQWAKRSNDHSSDQALAQALEARAFNFLTQNNSKKSIETLLKIPSLLPSLPSSYHFLLAEAWYRNGKHTASLEQLNNYFESPNRNKLFEQDASLLKCYVYKELNQKDDLQKLFTSLYPKSNQNPSIALGSVKPPITNPNFWAVSNDANFVQINHKEEWLYPTYVPYAILLPHTNQNSNAMQSFIKAGIGNLSSREIAMGLDLSQTATTPLYLSFTSSANKGKLDAQKIGSTNAFIYSQLATAGYNFDIHGHWNQQKFFYYGYDPSFKKYVDEDVAQRFDEIGLNVTLSNAPLNKQGINYYPSLALSHFADQSSAKQTSLQFKIPFQKEWLQNKLQTQLGLEYDVNQIKVDSALLLQHSNKFSIKPSVTYRMDNAVVKFGLYPTLAQKNHILPELAATYDLPFIRSQATINYISTLSLNTLSDLSNFNPYVKNHYSIKQSRENKFAISLQGNLLDNTMYTLEVGTNTRTNMPFFFKDSSGDKKQFNIVYDAKVRIFNGLFSFHYQPKESLIFGGKLSLQPILNLSSLPHAWNYIPAQLDLYQSFNLSRSIEIRTEAFVLLGYDYLEKTEVINKMYKTTSKAGMDLNLLSTIKLGKKISGYINVYNILGTKYQRWQGYGNFGTYFTLGLFTKFKSF